jgi:4'-phosphopantetheinyl transferase
LTAEEKKTADRFRREDDRNRFSTGRQALRFLVSKYLSVRPLDISVISEKGRKPFISEPAADIHFNISHSGDWVLIAFAHQQLGIDVEKINPEFDFNNLLEDHFSETEQSFISRAVDSVSAFYYLWTRKEALAKAWGTGLQNFMRQVSVLNLNSSLAWQQDSWKLKSFRISGLYPAALAYSQGTENLKYFEGGLSLKEFMRSDKG